MKVRRDISSVPFQSATDTWNRIIELITGSDSIDRSQLTAATGVMGSIITDEHPSARAIVVEGVGPQRGFEDCNLLSTGTMVARSAGTIISAGELTASATYWRAA